MVPVLSATPSDVAESSALAELALLPDQDLMSLWEQTQYAVAALETRGSSAQTARRYEHAVLMEMQRRLAQRSRLALFGVPEGEPPADEAGDSPHHLIVVKV